MKHKITTMIFGILLAAVLSACGDKKADATINETKPHTEIIPSEEAKEFISDEIVESVSGEVSKEESDLPKGRTSKDLKIVFQYYNDFDYWDIYDFSQTQLPTQELYEEVMTTYIAKIEELYSLTDWWDHANPEADTLIIVLQVSDIDAFTMTSLQKVLSNEVQSTLTIPKDALVPNSRFDQRLAHEIIHMMIDCFSVSLEEGLANYTSTKVGSSRKAFEYNGMDPVVNKKIYIENLISTWGLTEEEVNYVIEVVGDGTIHYDYFPNPELLALFNYQYSQAFVTYLVDTYGIEKVIDFIRNGTNNSAYETYLGKDLATLRQEWLTDFEGINTNIDMDYYNNLMKDYVYELDLD